MLLFHQNAELKAIQPNLKEDFTIMLYPNSHTPHLQKELFESPTSEYRSTPFWAWNGKLNPERLSEQIHFFKKMGFGGFHMHVRTGMDSP